MVNLNEVLVFVKVVECGSFIDAAKAMGKPPATVSRKVSKLEAALSTRLLQRTTRKISLTEDGRKYYQQCASALAQLEQANNLLSAKQQIPSGLLRISAPLSGQSGFMCNLVSEFLALYPQVNIKVSLSDDVVNLIDSGVDVAFRAGKLKDSSLVARKLGSAQLVLCASTDYINQTPTLNRPETLSERNCILFGHAHENVIWKLQKEDQTVAVPVSGRLTVNSIEFALQACLGGFGIALLPYAVIKAPVKAGKLHLMLPDYAVNIGGVYLVYPSKTHLSTTVRTFINFVMDKSSEDVPWVLD